MIVRIAIVTHLAFIALAIYKLSTPGEGSHTSLLSLIVNSVFLLHWLLQPIGRRG